jgi:hypothetical protein
MGMMQTSTYGSLPLKTHDYGTTKRDAGKAVSTGFRFPSRNLTLCDTRRGSEGLRRATFQVMEEPHFIGWYHQHPIRIYRDDDATTWRVVFEPRPGVDASGNPFEIRFPEARERTADAAKHTAGALAQNDYLIDLLPFEEIEWRTLRED